MQAKLEAVLYRMRLQLLRKNLCKDKRTEVCCSRIRLLTGQCLLLLSSHSLVSHKHPELYSGQVGFRSRCLFSPYGCSANRSVGRSTGQSVSTQSSQNLPTAPHPSPSVPQGSPSKQVSKHLAGSTRKSRGHVERELVIAARHRRQIATENYYHSLLDSAEIWICEFCEYERIFGEPPRTLIRDYEIKDRRHRQEEADRKRLLEKAKAKSRKGKRNNKASAKNGHTNDHIPDQPQATRPTDISPAMTNEQSRSTHSGDGYEDDNEDGDGYTDAPPRHNSNSVATHADPLPPPQAKT